MVDDGWVADFRSPTLSQLVKEAITNNQDLKAAYYRMVEARALGRQVAGAAMPTLGLGLEAGRAGQLDGAASGSNVAVDLQLSWEADLWGRVSNRQAAAHMDVLTEGALFEAVRQSIAAQVADAWIVVAGNQEKLGIVGREIASRQRSLRNVEARVEAQSLIAVDANLIRANLEQAKAQQAQLEGQKDSSIRVLEVLLGRYPEDQLAGPKGLPRLPRAVPAGLPSQLLQRRPDLVARERAVAAAYHRTREAEAARLPQLSLSANLTGRGSSLGNALDPASIVWGLVGNVLVPLLDGDSREQEVNARNARQAAALAEYGAAALRAFQEVEDALGSDAVLRHRLTHLQSAANELEAAIGTEQQRYDAGEVDLTRVEDARVQYYSILQSIADVRILRLRNRVALYRSLGGSFDDQPSVTTAASDG
jgi:NodT family efflux transporter outer membrane factor (OMF) lipoprotein